MIQKLQDMLRRNARRHASLCFFAASAGVSIYSLINQQLIHSALAAILSLVSLIAIRYAQPARSQLLSSKRLRSSYSHFFSSLRLALCWAKVHRLPQGQALQPQPTPSWQTGMPSAQMSELLIHVRELIPYIRRQIERPLMEKFKTLGLILSSLVLLFSFIRVMRENDGASTDLAYWIARAAVFMFIFTLAPAIISTMYKVGRTLTTPLENGIEEKRQAFNDTYYDFIHGTMIVKDEKNVFNDPLALRPGEDGWVGILTDGENGSGKLKGIEELSKATEMSSWRMDWLFFLLNAARGILQFGEVFLILLSGFIMIALRLMSPFMVAVGTDKKLAERITYPFVWGTVVFTLIFPVVRDVIIYIAYTVGAFGLMLYKGQAIYTIDDTTAELIKNNPYDPKFVIIISLVAMTVSGLCLWLSPYIAYRFATGQVFEAVSSTASGWMSAIVGSAIEFAGLKAGASIQRQAENTQIQGGYNAEMTRAKVSLEVGNLGAQARQLSSLASIEAGRQQAVSAIFGAALTNRAGANANANFTIAATKAQVGDSNRQTFTRAEQAQRQAQAQWSSDSMRVAGNSTAAKWDAWGTGMTAIPYVGAVPQAQYNAFGNTVRTRAENDANNWLFSRTYGNEQRTAQDVVLSQNLYRSGVEQAANTQRAETIAGINQGMGAAIGGANKGAAIASGGVNKAYKIELQANEAQFTGTKEAAAISRDAGFEAARDRQVGMVVTSMFLEILLGAWRKPDGNAIKKESPQ